MNTCELEQPRNLQEIGRRTLCRINEVKGYDGRGPIKDESKTLGRVHRGGGR